jgi:cyclophilin family peptidyl-prolyl cis-trans isomerase
MMKKVVMIFMFILLVSAGTVAAQEDDEASDLPTGTPEDICAEAVPADEAEERAYDAPPPTVIEPDQDYYALVCTEYGPVYIDLFEELAPVTVNNFVFLAQDNFYNNLTFHRVIEDFMAQGGDPDGNGTGGPGYQFQDEFVGFVTFDRPGLLAMANSGPNTNGSQFFITTVVTDWLNYNHTIFGEVLYGQDNVDAIPVTEEAPDAGLDAVLIYTDPTAVEFEYDAPPAPTREDFAEALGAFPGLQSLVLDEAASGDFDSAALADTLSDDLQEGASTFFETYNHDYAVVASHVNESCDLETLPLTSAQFVVHAFETRADAEAAIADEAFETVVTGGAEAETTTSEFYGLPAFLTDGTTTCDVDVEQVQSYRQLGRLVLVTSVTYPVSLAEQQSPALLVDQITLQLYEPEVADLLRAESVAN